MLKGQWFKLILHFIGKMAFSEDVVFFFSSGMSGRELSCEISVHFFRHFVVRKLLFLLYFDDDWSKLL